MFVVILIFLSSRSLNNGSSHRPSNVGFFTLLSDFIWKQFFSDQYVRFFESFRSLPHLVDN